MNTSSEIAYELANSTPEASTEEALSYNPEFFSAQGQRIGECLRIFADERLLSDHAIDAARLQAPVDTVQDNPLSPQERHLAAWQVMQYLTDPDMSPTEKEAEYMCNLWVDFKMIDKEASYYGQRLEEYGTKESKAALDALAGNVEIKEADWHNIRIGADVPRIVGLSRHVNVESIVARSALLLDRIATTTTHDSKLLKDVLEIETVYAPLLDILGLHASEAILRHHAEKARLMAAGREDIRQRYDEMSEYIESARESGLVEDVITDVVGVDFEENNYSFIIDNEETPYGSKSYYSAVRSTSKSGVPFRFISRIKSPGSATDKSVHHNEGKMPQDIYAGTVVVDDVDQMVTRFKEVYANIKALEKAGVCELVSAPSKDFPVHIKGTQEYMDAVKVGLKDEENGPKFVDEIDEGKPIPGTVKEPFQVLKVTFNVKRGDKVLPVEIQFQTIMDRNSSRLGGASHLTYKAENGTKSGLPGNVPGNSVDMLHANHRKWALLEKGGEEVLYSEEDQRIRKQKIVDVEALQQLLVQAAFYPEELEQAT